MKIEKFRQGPETNLINQITNGTFITRGSPNYGQVHVLDIKDKITVQITDPNLWTGTTARCLDILALQFTKNQSAGTKVTMSLREYMDLLGLKCESAARLQVENDLKALDAVHFTFKGNGKNVDRGGLRISGGYYRIKNNTIYFTFSEAFHNFLLDDCYIMDLNVDAFKINARRYPDAYFISKFLDLNYNLNANKTSLEYVYISTLLDQCRTIRLERAGKRKRQLLINPFFKVLDEVGIPYKVIDGKNINLELDKETISYTDFETARIKFSFKEHRKLLGQPKQ